MRTMTFISMRGTELCGEIVDQRKVPGKGIIYVVNKCGRIHGVVNGQALVDADAGGSYSELIKRVEGEI